MTYVITQPCVDLKDLACVEECPVDCIYEGNRMLYIPPRRVRRLRRLRAGLPGRGHLLRGRRPRRPGPVLRRQREVLRHDRQPRRRRQDGQDRRRPPDRRGAPAPGRVGAGLSGRLPDFPWDTIAAARATAPGVTPTASATCRSARPSTRCRGRDPRPVRRCGRLGRLPHGVGDAHPCGGRSGGTWSAAGPRCRCRTRTSLPVIGTKEARRPPAPPARRGPRRHGRDPQPPTRPTRSARASRAPGAGRR